MINKHTVCKYETPYRFPFLITQCFTNDKIMLKCGATEIRYNICRIKPYKLDTTVDFFNSINMFGGVNI